MQSAAGSDRQPPPSRLPKRRNAVWRLYDAPVYRDWAFLLTLFWAVVGFWSSAASPDSSTDGVLKRTFEAALAGVLISGIFGLLPATLRLWIRRWRWKRSQDRAVADTGVVETQPPTGREGPLSAHQQPVKPSTPPLGEVSTSSLSAPSSSQIASTPTAAPSPDADERRLDPGHRTLSWLEDGRTSMPYPVARALRTVQLTQEPRDQYELLLRAGETLSIVLGITSVAWCLERAATTEQINQLRTHLLDRGVSVGIWQAAAQSVSSVAGRSPGSWPNLAKSFARGRGGTGILPGQCLAPEYPAHFSPHGGTPGAHELRLEIASRDSDPGLGADIA